MVQHAWLETEYSPVDGKQTMSVRRRNWTSPKGDRKTAWVVDYVDQGGDRHIKTFPRKREADAYHATVTVDVRTGIHTADSRSVTIAAAGQLWLDSADKARLERTTREQYRVNLDLHIAPLIGEVKLTQFTMPMARGFEDQLAKDRSPAMVDKVMCSLGAILTDAQERGLVAQNVVWNLRRGRRSKNKARTDRRQRGKLKVGVDIPLPTEISAIIAHLTAHRALLLTAIFTGLRASELRGLRWQDIDLGRAVLHVRQRADPRTTSTSPSPTVPANRWRYRSSCGARSGRPRSPPVWSTPRGERSTAGCTHCATSTLHGASTVVSTAASNSRSSSCKAGSDTHRSR